jgi:hypothetical protein
MCSTDILWRLSLNSLVAPSGPTRTNDGMLGNFQAPPLICHKNIGSAHFSQSFLGGITEAKTLKWAGVLLMTG